MSLRAALEQIRTIEAGLSITDPENISGTKIRAYKIVPDTKSNLTAKVSFMNWPDDGREFRMGNMREDHWSVQIDCFVKADFDTGADLALAMFEEAWDAFDAQRPAGQRLSGTVDYLTLRAEKPMVELLEWNGLGYPGWHMYLDLVIFKDVTP